MALRTDQIAARYQELLGLEYDNTCVYWYERLQEVGALLLQALSPYQRTAYDMLLDAKYITSRELADRLDTTIAAASNVLRALARYGLVTESLLYMNPDIVAERPDLWGYSGYIWMLRKKIEYD